MATPRTPAAASPAAPKTAASPAAPKTAASPAAPAGMTDAEIRKVALQEAARLPAPSNYRSSISKYVVEIATEFEHYIRNGAAADDGDDLLG